MDMDLFFQAPLAAAPEYLPRLLQAVKDWQVSYLIPLTDIEVDLLCGEKAAFEALGCTVCTPDEACVRLCRDKAASAALLKEKGLCRTIPTFSPYGMEPQEEDYPLMLKPLHGRSSQGLAVVRSRAEFDAALKTRSDYIAQPYLPGNVYTVETARDRSGHCWALPRLELLRTVNGLGTTVRVLPDHPLAETCRSIAEAIQLVGVVNMEFIEHDGELYFLEINPRFSGGAGFTMLAGANFAQAELLCCRGDALPPMPPVRPVTAARKVLQVITEE